jgi:hypothetical protein
MCTEPIGTVENGGGHSTLIAASTARPEPAVDVLRSSSFRRTMVATAAATRFSTVKIDLLLAVCSAHVCCSVRNDEIDEVEYVPNNSLE